MEEIKIGIVEDDFTIRESLIQSIQINPSMTLAFAHDSIETTLETIQEPFFLGADIILLDIGLPGMNGIQGIQPILKKLPNVDIIMLTTYDETEKIFEAICNGARSYISKKTSLKVIMEAIFTVHRGGSYMSPSIARRLVDHIGHTKPSTNLNEKLTPRQMDIVSGLSTGLSYKMIAEKNGLSIDTVRSHIKKIYKVLQVNSKIEVVNLFRNDKK